MTWHSTARPHPITVHDWLAAAYPYRDRLHDEIVGRVACRAPITVSPPDKSFFGQAFEHAVGLDLAVEPPYPGLFDCLDPLQANRLLSLAGYSPPDGDPAAACPRWRKGTRRARPARLFAVAGSLAQVHRVLRSLGPTTPDTKRAVLRVLLDHRPVIRQGLGLTRFDGHPRSGAWPRKDVHHDGEHGKEAAPAAPLVHPGVQGRDRRMLPQR